MPDIHPANVKTKKNATEFVEFAIKLPGKEEKRKERESKEKQRQESHKAAGGDDANQQGGERRKRQRISKEKVDISKDVVDG